MGNDICSPEGPDVEGWAVLREGDARFDAEENDGQPYYYHPECALIWRRNKMGWGPPLVQGL